MRLDRRALLLAGGATAAVAVVAPVGALLSVYDTHRFIDAILRRNLDDALLSEPEVRKFSDAFCSTFERRYSLKQRAAWLAEVLPQVDFAAVEFMERDVVTHFLLGSDFFRPGRRSDAPIEFLALSPAACPNPFMRT